MLTGKPGYIICFHLKRWPNDGVGPCKYSHRSPLTSKPMFPWEDSSRGGFEDGPTALRGASGCDLSSDLFARLRLRRLRLMLVALFRSRSSRDLLSSYSLSDAECEVACVSINMSDRRFTGRASTSYDRRLRATILIGSSKNFPLLFLTLSAS